MRTIRTLEQLKYPEHSRGVSLYLAIIIMSILLALALAISAISLGQLKTVQGMGDSVMAYYAAETGIDAMMYNIYKLRQTTGIKEDWAADYGFEATVPSANDPNLYIKSVGWFRDTRRAIQTTIPGAGSTFPKITNASVVPPSGPAGTIFTIQTDISDANGVDPSTVIAHIQNPNETDIALVNLPLVSGDALSGTYRAQWSSAGQPNAAYFVDIFACNIKEYCSKLDNLETLIQQ